MATKIWTGPISGKWSDATKWGGLAPVTNDLIIIGDANQGAAFTVTQDVTQTIASLTMAGNHKAKNSTTLSVTQPAVLTVNGPITFDADSFINGAGTLVANGVIGPASTGGGTIIASSVGTLDITGTGSIASGVVLDFGVSTTVASTLKLDLSGGVTSAGNIRMNNAFQVLEIGPSTTLTINVVETIANGTLRMSGGTVVDTLGMVVGGQGAPGNIVGFGTIAANLSGGGQKAQIDTVTASGGTLVLTGGFSAGTATFVAAIDAVPLSVLKFDGAASVAQPIVINSASQTLEIGALGALTIAGRDVVTNGTIRMDGGTLTNIADAALNSGIVIDTAATLVGKGLITAGTTLWGDGIVKASGGTLELGSNLTAAAFATAFEIDSVNGSVLRIDGTVDPLVTVSFLGSSGVLELMDAGGVLQGFSGKIAGLNVGVSATTATNEINIQTPITKAVLSGSTITVLNGATTVGTLALSAAPVHGAYAVVQADATFGGWDVFLSNAPPVAPGGLTLAAASDSGTKGDGITNIVAPLIAGTGVAGDTIALFDGAALVGAATVDSTGNWSIAATSLVEGSNTLTATQSDAFGNASAASAALSITLDTVAPVLAAVLASDTGSSATDRITRNAALSGTADANNTVTVSNGGTVLGTATAGVGGAWSFTPVSLTDGDYSLTASETDLAGNIGSTTLTFTLDTVAPVAPGAPDLAAASDSGASSADNVTNVTTPTFSGTAVANATVTLFDGATFNGATVVGSGLADAAGNWSIATSALGTGVHVIAAKASDLAGNVSTASGSLSVTIDAAAPVAPGTPDLAAASDSGASSTDNITNVTTPTFTGTAESNTTVTLFDGAAAVGTGLANAGGGWSVTTGPLAAGVHALTARATDLAGNVSTASGALSVTVDTTAPATPSAPDLLAASDSGTSNIDNITNVTSPTFTGTAEANATVTLFDVATFIGASQADAAGLWSVTTSALAGGIHAITAQATDFSGNASTASPPLSVTNDATAPANPSVPDLSAASDSGVSNTDNTTNATTPTFTGITEANATVTLFDGAIVVGSGQANAAGVWSVTTGALADGGHAISAKATDLAGNVSAASGALSVTIDTTAPATVGTPDLAVTSDSGASNTDNTTNVTTPTFIGTAEANATVTLFDGTTVVGSGQADAAGNWSVTTSRALAAGVHVISAKATDLAGNVGTASVALSVTIDNTPPAAPGINQVTAAVVSGVAEGSSTIALFDGPIQLATASTSGTGGWSTLIALTPGIHAFAANAQDLAGNASAPSTVLKAIIGTSGNDVLAGGLGVNTMVGGAGDDTYVVDNALAAVVENLGEGTDTVSTSVSYILAAGSEVEVLNGTAATGLTLTGNEFANTVNGTTGNDTLKGAGGNDTLNGGTGADVMAGGTGNDTYLVDSAVDVVAENVGEGTDTILTTVSYTLAAGPEVEALTALGATGLTLTGNAFANSVNGATGNDVLNGGGGNDVLDGGAGNDTLNGGAGADTMFGGLGNDIYLVDTALDVVTEAVGGGTADKVLTSVSYTLAAASEVETLSGTGAVGLTLTGNAFSHAINGTITNDTLIGGIGADALNGGTGADTMLGGFGNDTYTVDNTGDVVTEAVGGGTADKVLASVNYTLAVASEVETLSGTGAVGLTLTGNAFSHAINGTVANDTLVGGAGIDALNGGAGADTMLGGLGNDTYFVDNAFDLVTENAGEGTDTVWAGTNYTLAAGSEVEFLRANAGATGLALIGNELSNTVFGNTGNDVLLGDAGDDTLNGVGGNDGLDGGAGNDTLNGGTGADTMLGGLGNDTFTVDNALDVVAENVGEGTADKVVTSVSYALATGSEVEILSGTGLLGLTLTGNAFSHAINGTIANDTLVGGAGNDALNGGAGADIMLGGLGNDTYTVDNTGDVVTEAVSGGSADKVLTSANYTLAVGSEVETLSGVGGVGLTLAGNEFANTVNGTTANDTLFGGAGNDTLNGGLGADVMAGGIGNDTYFVDNALDVVTENAGEGTDTIWAGTNYALTAASEVEFLRTNAATGLTLTGNALTDNITGNLGNDTLLGDAGNDTLTGGAGDDVLDGGANNDTMFGNAGNDVFRLLAGFGNDIIGDFDSNPVGGQDLLDVSGLGITATTFAGSVAIAASGNNTLITIGADSIRLNGVAAGTIDFNDFRLAP